MLNLKQILTEDMEAMLSFLRNLFLTLLLLLCLGSGSPLSIACPIYERNSLLNLKAAVVDEHNSLHSWQGFNCCTWNGVFCNLDRGHVAQLHLRGYRLGGYIHPSLFNLAHLQHLDLSDNSFVSTHIPPHVGKLKSLTFLDLSSAAVPYGNISSASLAHLSNLTSLEYLSLGGARILSSKWGEAVGRLYSLKYLRMSKCELTGPIPRSLVNLSSLLHLHLNDNSLSAEIPSWFENVTSHLLSLHLSSNELFGSIPAYLFHSAHQLQQLNLSWNGKLGGLDVSVIAQHTSSSLTSIDLSGTHLKGQIPSAMGNMSSLELLYLMDTNIEGAIPPSIGNLSKLVYLDLSGNKLNGTFPYTISELVKLEEIVLRNNSLSGSVELSLFHNMTRLQHLLIGGNLLTVSVNPTWIPQFEKFMSLGLHSCNLAGIPSFLVNQYYLKGLVLSANNIRGNIPSWIWDLPNLHSLVLASNQFMGSLPPILTPNALQVLDLHNNSLQGALPLPPPSVHALDLSMNQFNASIPSDIGTYIKNAMFLSLSRNNFTGGIPKSVCTKNMKVLDLSYNMLSHKIPLNFTENCSNLRNLNLAGNHLEGNIFREWGKLKQFHTLNLNGNYLQGAIPSSIAECYSLRILDLGNNNFQGTIPEWIGNLSQLHILMLRGNEFHGSIPSRIIGLKNLQILDLSHNKLSGSIPRNLTNLQAMVNSSQSNPDSLQEHIIGKKMYSDQITLSMKGQLLEYIRIQTILKCMDLSNNNLSGGIPPKMGSLQGLISLNLSGNNLSGYIPKSLGGMAQLESLDLSANKLEGNIPLELQSLNYLQVLNLSFNRLDGKVPLGGQFLTFGESSYLGNSNLSGIPFTANTTCSSSFCHHGEGDDRDNSDEEEDSECDMQWWAVGVGLSYGVGFSIVVGVLTFNNKIRNAVFNLYDGIILAIFKRG